MGGGGKGKNASKSTCARAGLERSLGGHGSPFINFSWIFISRFYFETERLSCGCSRAVGMV